MAHKFRVNYYVANERQYTPEYILFRDRVIEDLGTIDNADAAQNAFDHLSQNPTLGITRYYDSRFGVRPASVDGAVSPRWYSILGANKTAYGSIYGRAHLEYNSELQGKVWNAGTFNGGITPAISANASYTWGMRFNIDGVADGYIWGNRYGQTGTGNGWTFLMASYWRNYYEGYDRDITFFLPRITWLWVWTVKEVNTVTLYDDNNNIIVQIPNVYDYAEQELGIAGATFPDSHQPTGFRYQRFITANTALTFAQRQALQSI